MYSHKFESIESSPIPPPEASLRYSHRAVYGEQAKWLPPHRLIPSFASADGQSAVYRRRSQIVLTEDDGERAGAPTSFMVGKDGMRVYIDPYGYARITRAARTQQHVDPLSNRVDGADDMEREAALVVCEHLNEHVEAMAFPQRWTPRPDEQLVPVAVRSFPEPEPEAPKTTGKGPKTLNANERQAFADYLDARAAWLTRRLAFEANQRTLRERAALAAQGHADVMREHLISCLRDVLWPLPTTISFVFRDVDDIALDVLVPGLADLPDREAALAAGNRVSVRRMSEVVQSNLNQRHGLGLVVRLIGELFAALPTAQRVTVSALRASSGHRPQAYIASAQADRARWSAMYARGTVTEPKATQALQTLQGRFNVTGLGAFLPIEPFA
jgi:hypothetical protein